MAKKVMIANMLTKKMALKILKQTLEDQLTRDQLKRIIDYKGKMLLDSYLTFEGERLDPLVIGVGKDNYFKMLHEKTTFTDALDILLFGGNCDPVCTINGIPYTYSDALQSGLLTDEDVRETAKVALKSHSEFYRER